MKKVLLLADEASSHTQKWADAVKANGFDVRIFSIRSSDKSDLQKASYIQHLSLLKKTVREYKPDLMHAHYATSYGLLAALSGFKPYLISVWGSDIFDFPKRSFFHRQILKYNLRNSKCVVSSSNVMAQEVRKYFSGPIEIIPFGIDLSVFKRVAGRNKMITVGIIKSMEDYYGIEELIRAFKSVRENNSDTELKLLLVGGGTKIEKYKQIVSGLGLNEFVEFRGKISQDLVPAAHNEIDIFVNPSVHESFGVSVLEASACQNPVVATNVGGLKEVVVNNSTGLIVEQGNQNELIKAISYFVENREQIDIFGKRGRAFVSGNYDQSNVRHKIKDLYTSFLKSGKQ
ncbi:MAG: glycosyltransferase [Bacteroidetes bacterium]|nr:glycosyltransferase [Bacteroidota bacterium]